MLTTSFLTSVDDFQISRRAAGGPGLESKGWASIWKAEWEHASLEIFIPFEKFKRCTKRKYFVVWVVSHFTYNIVMRKRVKLNSYEPFVRDKNMKFVTHSWYNKILSFGTPFELLKTYKIFQWLFLLKYYCMYLLLIIKQMNKWIESYFQYYIHEGTAWLSYV